MAYTTPNTVGASDVLTSALWNTQIRDNFEAVRNPPSCMVTNGSIVYSEDIETGPYVTFESAVWDNDGNLWDAADPKKITIQEDGIYLVRTEGGSYTTSVQMSDWSMELHITSGATVTRVRTPAAWGNASASGMGYSASVNCSWLRQLSAGDYLQTRPDGGLPGGSGTVTVPANNYYFSVTRISGV